MRLYTTYNLVREDAEFNLAITYEAHRGWADDPASIEILSVKYEGEEFTLTFAEEDNLYENILGELPEAIAYYEADYADYKADLREDSRYDG